MPESVGSGDEEQWGNWEDNFDSGSESTVSAKIDDDSDSDVPPDFVSSSDDSDEDENVGVAPALIPSAANNLSQDKDVSAFFKRPQFRTRKWKKFVRKTQKTCMGKNTNVRPRVIPPPYPTNTAEKEKEPENFLAPSLYVWDPSRQQAPFQPTCKGKNKGEHSMSVDQWELLPVYGTQPLVWSGRMYRCQVGGCERKGKYHVAQREGFPWYPFHHTSRVVFTTELHDSIIDSAVNGQSFRTICSQLEEGQRKEWNRRREEFRYNFRRTKMLSPGLFGQNCEYPPFPEFADWKHVPGPDLLRDLVVRY
jgi:hypothetical protein